LRHEREDALAKHDYKRADRMKLLMDRHQYHQQSERQENTRRADLANKHPEKYCHIIMDGGDGGKSIVRKIDLVFFLLKQDPSCITGTL
jgi:hypothetical protein